jgi:hypothetical protein
LFDVEHTVVAKQEGFRLARLAVCVSDGLSLADMPKRDDGRLFAFANVSAEFVGLIERQPCVGPVLEIVSPRSEVEEVDRGSQTILIVQDDADLLQITHRSLERVGYAILAARNPMEAIQIAESHPGPIHLMVTNVMLPGINGAQ